MCGERIARISVLSYSILVNIYKFISTGPRSWFNPLFEARKDNDSIQQYSISLYLLIACWMRKDGLSQFL